MNDIKKIILDEIEKYSYTPLTPNGLYAYLFCNKYVNEEDFLEALQVLVESYQVSITKKGKIVRAREMGYLTGTFSSSSKGTFGFVTAEEGEYFIPPKMTNGAYYGDEVVIKKLLPSSSYFGKGNEAEVITILKRGLTEIIGTLSVFSNGRAMIGEVVPENERLHLTVRIPAKKLNIVENGLKVICKITNYPKNEEDFAYGEITEVLGRADSLEANYKGILHENGISTTFPDEVIKNAQDVSIEPLSADGRIDLRDEIIFTIDSESAKDLDDAISLKVTENGYILGVHIADVSHYVRADSPLDREAYERGTSVYFTDKVVPMLPKELSNEICSLNGGVDRYALSALVTLDKSGTILSCELVNSIINSKMRGVYAEFNDILENGEESEFYSKYRHVMPVFYNMMELYRVLKQRSESKGAMELDSEEAKILLDEGGHPIDVCKIERGESERLIEQFMLCANEAVATYLFNASLPCVYRVHDEPEREKIDAFSVFAKNLGVDVSPLRTKNKITPSQLSAVLKSSEEKGCFPIVSSILLRSLMKARYSSVQKSHFGLNTEYYCHFTSPIRRYPDLCVHRIIKAVLAGELNESNINDFELFASNASEMSSENELKAVHAEREIDDLYKCVYMADRIGEEYDAVICSVNSFGFFAKTDKLCEGLVPIESLGDGYTYDRENYTLSRGSHVYRLGMEVKIRVRLADISLRQVEFELVGQKNRKAASEKPFKKHDRRKKGYSSRKVKSGKGKRKHRR